jgi:hypothetical protein
MAASGCAPDELSGWGDAAPLNRLGRASAQAGKVIAAISS